MLFIYIVLTFHLNSGIFFVDDVVVIVDLVGVHILQSTIHKTNSMVKLEYDNFNKKNCFMTIDKVKKKQNNRSNESAHIFKDTQVI